jgi:hypothetical protein
MSQPEHQLQELLSGLRGMRPRVFALIGRLLRPGRSSFPVLAAGLRSLIWASPVKWVKWEGQVCPVRSALRI